MLLQDVDDPILEDLGVANKLHRKALLRGISELQQTQSTPRHSPPAATESSLEDSSPLKEALEQQTLRTAMLSIENQDLQERLQHLEALPTSLAYSSAVLRSWLLTGAARSLTAGHRTT